LTSTTSLVEFLGATIVAVEFVAFTFTGTVPAERDPAKASVVRTARVKKVLIDIKLPFE
jgi:hypothetical protein